MTTEHLFRDFCVLYLRLFDHQPVLQGNINLFLKEFQEKRGDREFERLKLMAESTTSLNDQIIPDITHILDENLTQLAAKVSVAKEMIDSVADLEGKTDKQWLTERKEARKEVWEQFMAGQVVKSSLVDKDYNKQVQDVQDYYSELEAKLITSAKPVL